VTVNIDMNDPGVARLMGQGGGIVQPGGQQRELVQIAGDVDTGISSTTRLDLGKQEVIVADKDRIHILTVDIYAIPGEPLKAHLICPRCKHQLTIDEGKKPIDFRPRAPNPLGASILADLPPELHAAGAVGQLSIETFVCTWELEDRQQDAGKQDLGVIARGSLCRYRGSIDRNVLKEG
jgi:hypothetical protein